MLRKWFFQGSMPIMMRLQKEGLTMASENKQLPRTTAFTQSALNVMKEIDRAIAFHLQWMRELHQTLICGSPHNPDNLAEDAHCRCKFGRWYHAQENSHLARSEGYAELGERHKSMHDHARAMLTDHLQGGPVKPGTYDGFMEVALAFRTEAQSYQQRLINQVCAVDQLTGAWNRHAMILRLSEESERVRRTDHPCSICLMDIDHFKQINDRHGHINGDRALQAVVHFLSERMRSYDSLFRYGGEEFLICLPNTSLDQAASLLNRMREELATLDIDLGDGQTLRLTASFGVAELNGHEPFDASIDRADHALLCAKAKGRNQVCSWDLDGHPTPSA
jgi:diguanylate cyclase